MKTKELFIIIFIWFETICGFSQSQTTVYTPMNSAVRAYNSIPEMTYQDKLDLSDSVEIIYPNATEINPHSATTSYNCHAYAWHVSEGGSNVWIGFYSGQAGDEDVYWTDVSYIRVSNESDATKISYYMDNHSAIQTSTQGTYRSKWGAWPLMEHARDYGPAVYQMDYRYYYAQPVISGDNIICYSDSRTYSVQDFNNVTYSWITSSNLQVNGSNTNRTVSVSPTTSTSEYGTITVSIYVTNYNKTRELTKSVWLGVPSIPTGINNFPYNGKEFGSDSDYDFRVNCSNNQGIDDYQWVVSGGTITEGQGTDRITVHTDEVLEGNEYFDVHIRTGNDCGWSSYFWRTGYVVPGSGEEDKFVVYPNPSSSEITVSVAFANKIQKPDSKTGDEVSVRSLEIFNNYGVKVKTAQFGTGVLTTKLDISSLRSGTYQIKIHYDDKEETHSLIKK